VVKKPNILFLFTDDQRFDTIGALGNDEIYTPNLDRLVERGTVFTHAHIPCGTSGAVCMPSRAMLNTGRTLFHLQGEGQEIPVDHVTMGEAFQSAGYYTFGTGKWHNGIRAYARSFIDGANIFFGGMWDHWNVPICDYDPSGKYDNAINYTMDFMGNNRTTKIHCDKFSTGKHSTELISDGSIEFIKKYNNDSPFFMYVSFLAPHDPRTMPERFRRMYDPEKISLPKNYMDIHPFEYGVEDIRDEVLAPYPRTPEIIKRHIAEYYGMISHLDYEIGRILNALEDKGILEDTIIVFTGDNGLAVGQHGLMGKQNLYDHSLRVPLIFAGPGIPEGEKRDSLVYLFDIFPTLCELIGVEIPSSVEGDSLLKAIYEKDIIHRETMYFAYTDKVRGIRDRQYKLIEYRYKDIKKTQLFDTINDPWELCNLHDKEDYKEIEDRLKSELIGYREQWDDEKHPMGEIFWKNY
jgi:arylsulfatase A-like enzyme